MITLKKALLASLTASALVLPAVANPSNKAAAASAPAAATSSAGGGSSASNASAPTLKIGGTTIINAYFGSQKDRRNGKGNTGPHLSIDVADLYFLVSGMTSNGIKYGYTLNFNGIPGGSPTIDQNYIQFSGAFGTIQFGAVVGPEDSMIKDGITILSGTGGPDGGFSSMYNVPAFVMRGNDTLGDTNKATKIVYYTPTFLGGFTIGVAFTPNTNHMGDSKLNTANNDGNSALPGNRTFMPIKSLEPYGLRNVAIGLTYKRTAGQWSFTGSGALVSDKSYISGGKAAGSSRLQVRNTLAYQLGLVLGYRTASSSLIEFGAGYLDNGKSRLPKVRNQSLAFIKPGAVETLGDLSEGNAGKAWNVGMAYTAGAYKMSLGYQNRTRKTSRTEKTKLDVFSLGGEVTPVQGLKFIAEVNHVRGKTNATAQALNNSLLAFDGAGATQAIGNNNATIFVLGTKISF